MKYLFIINPRSGINKNKTHLSKLIKEKYSYNFKIEYTEYAGHASLIAETAKDNGIENIVAVGGDGTMNEVAGCLVNTDINFGLIPMGSGNGLARSLGLPLKVDNALDVVFKTKVKRIDTGKINSLPFFAVAGIGFDAQVASKFQNRKLRGPLPYFFIGLKEYLNYSYRAYSLKCQENDRKIEPLLITFANAPQFGIGAKIAPNADMEDGLLDVCTFEKMSIIKAFFTIRKMFNGKVDQVPTYFSFRSKKIDIEADGKEFIFHTDGEPHLAETGVSIEIIPHSLNVIVA